jgi:hypothetical protein
MQHLWLSAAGCGQTAADRCESNDDCASGFCRADQTCAPEADADVGPDGTTPADAAAACAPNHDGTIDRSELPLEPGRTGTFRVSFDPSFDTAGQIDGEAQVRWDLSGDLSGDADRIIELMSPAGAWWEAQFPAASYATILSAESDLLGVFELQSDRLRLLGVVSPDAGLSRTELAYDPPVDVLRLPLTPSLQWTIETTVTGLAQGIGAFYTESYAYRVDAIGQLDTPFGEFPVSRVAIDFSQQVGLLVTTRRSFAFVAECFSTVANVVSQDNESGAEFSDPAEVRRLAP